jgi:electron transfer flavoprotein alpha subunit
MSGVLVIAEARNAPGDEPALRALTLELIGAGRELSRQGAGALAVALVDHEPEPLVDRLALEGVEELLVIATPEPRTEPHVSQAAVEALLERCAPSVVLAGHTIDSLGYAPAVAARGRHGFASDVTGVWWGSGGARAQRPAYGERLVAELDFAGKQTVLLLLRPGAFAPANGAGSPAIIRVQLDLTRSARSEQVELREATDGREIAKADFLLSIGRGVGAAEHVARMQRLAEAIGATLAVSGPLVEAGWAPRALKVGQSGKTVAPRVYLALGISGAAQHVGGMSRSQTIIAVNSDPRARIFDFAHYGAVADLFEVADELERQLG